MAGTLYVLNNDPDNFSIRYYDNGDPEQRLLLEEDWQTFERFDPSTRELYQILVRPTNHVVEVAVDRLIPGDPQAGRYRIEVFIPGKRATTRRAVFSVVQDLLPGEEGETVLDDRLVLVDMSEIFDVWYTLGEYDLEPEKHSRIGRVRQYDLSREDPPEEVSFGPVRWVLLPDPAAGLLRYDSPVGTAEERDGPFPTGRVLFRKYPAWAGEWFDVNPFLTWYTFGYHTGSDLNLPGVSGADKGEPVYAVADGMVTYSGRAGTWGNIIVVEHADGMVTHHDGHIERQPVYSRYGHVDDRIQVRAGESVARGQLLGYIGLAAGATAGWHLHFDICYTDALKRRPSYWPNTRNSRDTIKAEVLRHFIDPFQFIRDNHIVETET